MHLEITPNEWRILEDLVQLLHPFKVATVHVSGEKYPTVSAIGPLVEEIKKRVKEDESDSIATKEVKKALHNDIRSHNQNPDVRLLFDKASLLDPRFKSLCHLPSVQQSEVIDSLSQEVLAMLNTPVDDIDEQSRL